mmetsp:Transcript_108320/g.305390  ORF Transcript_108320/g.305390 Transcript_108320/m.305390 type:complete len:230 (+) Transcript_108320:1400-2089(+)
MIPHICLRIPSTSETYSERDSGLICRKSAGSFTTRASRNARIYRAARKPRMTRPAATSCFPLPRSFSASKANQSTMTITKSNIIHVLAYLRAVAWRRISTMPRWWNPTKKDSTKSIVQYTETATLVKDITLIMPSPTGSIVKGRKTMSCTMKTIPTAIQAKRMELLGCITSLCTTRERIVSWLPTRWKSALFVFFQLSFRFEVLAAGSDAPSSSSQISHHTDQGSKLWS